VTPSLPDDSVSDPYLPIEDYGAIGNLRTVALVGRNGSVDWWCAPHLDDPSVFGALLDDTRGGRFRIRARGVPLGQQRYLEHTNVLETTFDGDRGSLVVTDLMALTGSIEGTCGDSPTEPTLYRLLHARGGPVEVEVHWSPRPDHARSEVRIMAGDDGHLAWAGDDTVALQGLDGDARVVDTGTGPAVEARFTLDHDEQRLIATSWGGRPQRAGLDDAHRLVEDTVATWRSWVHKAQATGARDWAAPHAELIVRAELALKLLTHAETGAVAAAATTSLPEEIGGVRNWDYRYAWIRDAALAAQALFALGHEADAISFIEWAEDAARTDGDGRDGLKIVYGLHGQTEMPERELTNLEGYRRSSPVRVGNEAVEQLQLDIYGELISAAYEMVRAGHELSAPNAEFLPQVADEACRRWQEPDYGLWELRNGPMHFVYSKVMVWMALDRALRLADCGAIAGDTDRWRSSRDAVRDEVLQRGFDAELGSFKQSYERAELDASNVLIGLLEFLPFDDPRVRSTLDATLSGLRDGNVVRRYVADDGVAGGEGAFGLCVFWMVDALALSGRLDEAREIYESMVARANHVGLYAEQVDPATGALLGNFPQAFTHLGLINSALYLAHAEGRDSPVAAPIGSDAHRTGAGEHREASP
jgi:pentatricopeptide repeat protein